MSGKLTLPPSARSIVAASAAAVRQGHTQAMICLLNGHNFTFNIHEVLDDGLMGTRLGHDRTPALVPAHAIAFIEFPQ